MRYLRSLSIKTFEEALYFNKLFTNMTPVQITRISQDNIQLGEEHLVLTVHILL